jgi:hypothetical protein
MILHARINLTGVDLAKFDAYENTVIPLLDGYGISLVARLRADDGQSEVHILDVPDEGVMELYRADETRQSVQHLWDESGATGEITVMQRLD